MEGYFNVSGSHNSFDDFDIEGKKSFDIVEKKQNNFKAKFQPIGLTPVTQEEADKNRLLDMTVDLDNGAVGYVFSLTGTGYNAQWKCHVCDMIFMGIKNLLFHERSMNHSALMQASKHHASQFIRMEMKDDEPGPPGVDENEEDSEPPVLTNIQSTLDDYKTTPLIGLEYVVELNDDYEKESAYVCMLCDKKGDPRTVMAHLISYNHRLKYLERHFPITFNAINSLPKTVGARRGLAEIVLRISSEMEETFGRLRPVATDGRHFEENRFSLMCTINKSKHFIETPDKTFVHLVDRELLTAASLKTEEIPVPEGPPPINPSTKPEEAKGAMETKDEDDDEIEFQGAFVKGTRVPVTRQLRVRKLSVEAEDKNNEIATKSNEKPATSPNKKEDEVKSQCSLSSISSASSSPRSPRYRRRSSLSRSRSRSGSRNRRRRRSRSRGRYRRTRSRSRSRSRRSRSPYGNRRRQRSPRGSRVSESKRDEERKRPKERVDDISAEKAKWEKFREEVAIVEKQMLEKLSHHEKNPEKHPQYPDEWKLFWNRRYKELQQSGRDPNKHDFKPEWIEFWNRRMRELHEAEFMKRKEELREKLGLPLDEPKPHYNRRKKFLREGDLDGPAGPGGQAPRGRSRSPSPWEEGAIGGGFGARDRDFPPYRQGRGEWRNDRERSPPRTITVLRMLTALEQQLGSLGPRVNSTLSEAIGMEKLQNGNSDALLRDQQVVVLFETVKEKFKGLLLAGIVERNMVMATRNAIGAVTELLYRAPALLERVPRAPSPVKPKVEAVAVPVILPAVPVPTVAPKLPAPPATPVPAPDPVTVPGIGAVDKAAIAREIAAALIMQGKTNVSEDELEQLVSAVVGMAQAQAGSQQTVTTAQFLSAMQPVGQATPPSVPTPTPTPTPVLTPAPTLAPAPVPAAIPVSSPEVSSPLEPAALVPAQQTPEVSGLQLLQSAYDADDLKGGSLASKDKVFLPAMRTSAAESMESSSSSLPFKPTLTVGGSSQANNPIRSTAHSAQALDAYVDELTETDLRLLLQSFKDLPLDEQHGLIRYLKKLEATDPVKVEKLRKYVNLGSSNAKAPPKTVVPTEKLQALAKVGQSGRLSPFSSRMQSRNPSQCEPKRPEMLKLDSDSDDDYSFDDVCKAAKKKVSEQEAVEAERKREEEIKKKRELEEMNRRLREEKAKAEQALREIEDREREQQRIMREKERQEREQAMKVGAANWTPVSSNNSTLGSLVTSVPPPSIPPPPIPPTVPPPTMANMYNSGYGDVTGALGNFNGGPTYYGSNTFSQFPQRDGSYDQQGGYYQGQQANAVYQQQPTYNAQGFSAYPNNSMYQQAPPTHTTSQHQGYSVGPYGNGQFRY